VRTDGRTDGLTDMRLRITASRHSAFYSPLLSCVEFLRRSDHEVVYGVLSPGQKSYVLLGSGEVDVMQSAVSSNWKLMDRGMEPLPVHFAQINRRDGFFLVGRQPDAAFDFRKLEGATLLADHGLQPLVMLKYAVRHNGADWNRIRVVDAGTPEEMAALWSTGAGDYVHLQGPVVAGEAAGEIVASVGAAVPPVAFSSLCCARRFLETPPYRVFLEAYGKPASGCGRPRPKPWPRRRRRSSRKCPARSWRTRSGDIKRWDAGTAASRSRAISTNRL
jgi:NitT/TauT family transport system substrate-binding protein